MKLERASWFLDGRLKAQARWRRAGGWRLKFVLNSVVMRAKRLLSGHKRLHDMFLSGAFLAQIKRIAI
jgi:hypothetical protein